MQRKRLSVEGEDVMEKGGLYFTGASSPQFFTSGCALLDCVLGGGWALGRISNVVGDKSTGKTLLAIEAAANFCRRCEDGRIWYAEAEAAFDPPYAERLGLPLDVVEFEEIVTVEDLFESLQVHLAELIEDETHGLYIVDSLDALSDRAEMGRDIDKDTYGAGKAKQMSQLFRRLVRNLGERLTVMIISQVRDDIGAKFGRKVTRSGGRALDFYASQVLYLSHMGRIKAQRGKVERPIGVKIRAMCDKNKVAPPFRQCDFPVLFQYGMDDMQAGLEWLVKIGRCAALGFKGEDAVAKARAWRRAALRGSRKNLNRTREKIAHVVVKVWAEVEARFEPECLKYG